MGGTTLYDFHSGWWFGTWLDYDFPYIGNVIIPTDELIFFRGVETTNQYIYIYIYLYMYMYMLYYLFIYHMLRTVGYILYIVFFFNNRKGIGRTEAWWCEDVKGIHVTSDHQSWAPTLPVSGRSFPVNLNKHHVHFQYEFLNGGFPKMGFP